MDRKRWSVQEVVQVCSVCVAILAVLAVLILPSDVSVKIAACVATFAAFWWGRAQGWEDRSTPTEH